MNVITQWLTDTFSLAKLNIGWNDVIEIFVFTFLLYHIIIWIQRTRAWVLLKGVLTVGILYVAAQIFQMNNLIWLFQNSFSMLVIVLVIVFQPEFRKALEQLGNQKVISGIVSFDNSKDKQERFSEETINAIIDASFDLGRAKTGALIVIEQNILLNEYIDTGIILDAKVSAPLLVQIFEHNTPLHDGAVVIRGDQIIAATCYLPLSDNMHISKDLGTRHRAGLGISEVTDSITVIASEETGHVSIAIGGELFHDVDRDKLRAKLNFIQKKDIDVKRFKLWKGKRWKKA